MDKTTNKATTPSTDNGSNTPKTTEVKSVEELITESRQRWSTPSMDDRYNKLMAEIAEMERSGEVLARAMKESGHIKELP